MRRNIHHTCVSVLISFRMVQKRISSTINFTLLSVGISRIRWAPGRNTHEGQKNKCKRKVCLYVPHSPAAPILLSNYLSLLEPRHIWHSMSHTRTEQSTSKKKKTRGGQEVQIWQRCSSQASRQIEASLPKINIAKNPPEIEKSAAEVNDRCD